MGNKVDKEEERQVSTEQAKQWCKDNGDMPYFETSALNNIAVDEAFITMIKKALDNQVQDEMQMPDSIGAMGGTITLDARKNS